MKNKTDKETLDVVIVPPAVALWQRVVEAREFSIKNLKESIIIEEAFLKTAKEELDNAKQLSMS